MFSILPICKYKYQIINSVCNHYVTIVVAETGAGKSTKVPQFLMNYFERVVITEPRRMAARTLAYRVADEMNTSCGEVVGFKTALDSCVSPETKVIYCTDGLQVVTEIFNNDTSTNRVLIIDEVHEWNINMEVLLAWVKQMEGKWNTHVVIMSATLDGQEIQNYFDDASVINVPGSTFPVKDEYRDVPNRSYQEGWIVQTIKEKVGEGQNCLVFLPGKREIGSVMESLQMVNAEVIPLHGELEWKEQSKAFLNYGKPKVILATNVAQTSITIDDIDVVIDAGLARVKRMEKGIESLFLEDVSQYDIQQRRGRVGRTKPGTYILVSSLPIDMREEETTPEIMRSQLDRVVLQLASIGVDAESMEFFHQPDKSSILHAKEILNELGAMKGETVTEIGQKMAKMPLSPQLARMIVEAEKLGVVEEIIKISAIVEMGGFLKRKIDLGWIWQRVTNSFWSPRECDLLVLLDIWNCIDSKESEKSFTDLVTIKKKVSMVKQYIEKLQKSLSGLIEMSSNPENTDAIIQAAIRGFGSSNVFVRSSYEESECVGKGEVYALIDKYSVCYISDAHIFVGKPITFQTEQGNQLTILSFVTTIPEDMLIELFPNLVTEDEPIYELCPASIFRPCDSLRITTKKRFAGNLFSEEVELAGKEHPMFQKAWNEYYNPENETVTIADNEFPVIKHRYYSYMEVTVDPETLFKASEKECTKHFQTKTGNPIIFKCIGFESSACTLEILKKSVEREYCDKLAESEERIRMRRIGSFKVLTDPPKSIILGKNNAGFGNENVVANPHLVIHGDNVYLEYFIQGYEPSGLDENPKKALQILYYQYLKTNYPDKKFATRAFSKKGRGSFENNGLNASEQQKRDDFYSFAEEMVEELSITGIEDTLAMLEEYFNDVMGG